MKTNAPPQIRARRRVVKAPPREKTTFSEFQKEDLKSSAIQLDVDSLITMMLSEDATAWIPILITAKDTEFGLIWRPQAYSKVFVDATATRYQGGKHVKDWDGLTISSLCQAASQMASNITYANDNGDAYFAYDGLAILQEGIWMNPAQVPNKNVVPINSNQAVDLQLFCSSVNIASKAVVIPGDDGKPQTYHRPTFVKKNSPDKESVPVSIKNIFQSLLVGLPENDELTFQDIQKASFIFEAVADSVVKCDIPIEGIPLELAYFAFVKKSFPYIPGAIALDDVMYASYPNINKDILSQLNKYSFVVGGRPVDPGHFFSFGLKEAKCKTIGGFVPKDYCRYNTTEKITWESVGCAVESTLLKTKVNNPRPTKDFDGLWYDPCKVRVQDLKKASGLIIPYDKAASGLNFAEKWVMKKRKQKKDQEFRVFATYGPSPLLWVEAFAGCRWSRAAADDLWKSMPTMNLYNFAASLNRNKALAEAQGDKTQWRQVMLYYSEQGLPVDPVAIAHWMNCQGVYTDEDGRAVHVPHFQYTLFPLEFLPGRHLSKEKATPVSDQAAEDFQMFGDHVGRMASADPKARAPMAHAYKKHKPNPAHADHDQPSPSYDRTEKDEDPINEDDDDEVNTNDEFSDPEEPSVAMEDTQ